MKKTFPKLLLCILTASIILTACGGNPEEGNNTETDGTKVLYERDTFSILIPQDWEIIESNQFPSSVPQEVVVAFQNNIRNEIFTSNITVSAANFPDPITPDDFAKNSKRKIRNEIISFREISTEEIQLPFEESSIPAVLTEIEGKRTPTDPIVRFKQLYLTDRNTGYTITASYLPNEDEGTIQFMNEILDSFRIK